MLEELVSVIIPHYNDSIFIERCINSVKKQTYKNIEIIVVDDCSNAEHVLNLFNLKKKFSFLIVELDINKGQANAKNIGVAKSSGNVIAFIDSDDYVEENFINDCVLSLRSNQMIKAVSTNLIMEDLRTGNKIKFKPTGGMARDFIRCNAGTGYLVMERSIFESVGGFNITFRGWEDWDFNIRLLRNGGLFYVIDKFSYHYTVGKNSTTQRISDKIIEIHRKLITSNSDFFIENFEILVDDYLYWRYIKRDEKKKNELLISHWKKIKLVCKKLLRFH
jgi:glycosyltransferase involved in cell wall biosynthesis